MQLSFDHVQFAYPSSSAPVFEGLTLRFPEGWTALAGSNGSGKTTLMKLACGILSPDRGEVTGDRYALYCPQCTDTPPRGLEQLFCSPEARTGRILSLLGVRPDWPWRWSTLSHGERKRAQIATALCADPPVLAVDEPANHLDQRGRKLLVAGLREHRGVGILVSHDRGVLDAVCRRTVFLQLRGGRVREYGCSYTRARERLEEDAEASRREYRHLSEKLSEAQGLAQSRREVMASKASSLSKRGMRWRDHDGKSYIDGLRLSSRAKSMARRMHEAENRARRLQKRLSELDVCPERRLSFWMPGSGSARDILLSSSASDLALGEETLSLPPLAVGPTDRIGITGDNGSGKSTLVNHLLEGLRLSRRRMLHMPQELPDGGDAVVKELLSLKSEDLGRIMNIVGCLGSDPGRVLDGGSPSPGELRKILLAMSVEREPQLLVLDEPTNHLDLESVELLEAALAEFPGALVLVSHDHRFLKALTRERWRLSDGRLRRERWPDETQEAER